MKFNKQFLVALLDNEPIKDTIVGHSRWSVNHERIFTHEGHFYCTRYSVGATEYQHESPYEYAPDEIECQEVIPVQEVVTVYKDIVKRGE